MGSRTSGGSFIKTIIIKFRKYHSAKILVTISNASYSENTEVLTTFAENANDG
jgi:hypothetical protein